MYMYLGNYFINLVILQVLASCINPGGSISPDFINEVYREADDVTNNGLPSALPELLSQSCLVPAISSYLRNDSGEK